MKRKIDLFRFASLRAVQQLEPGDKLLNFIFLPDSETNYFLTDIPMDIDSARVHVQEKADEFENETSNGIFESIFDVESLDAELWKFSNYLMKDGQTITSLDEIEMPGNTALNSTQIQRLWNNVFYSIVKKDKYAVRQACLQMIVADNFIKKTNPLSDTLVDELIKYPKQEEGLSLDEKKKLFLRRLAGASVVIPAAFTVKRNYAEDGSAKKKASLKVISGEVVAKGVKHISKEKKQILRHEIELAKVTVSILDAILKEIEALKKQYDADYQTEYEKKYNKYVSDTATVIQQYLDKQKDDNNKAATNISFPKKSEIPVEILPVFNFDYPDIFGDYCKDKLSPKTLAYIAQNNFEKEPYEMVHDKIVQQKKETQSKASQIVKTGSTKVAVNGMVVEKNNSLYDYSLSFHYGQDLIDINTIYFLLTLDYAGAYFNKAYVKLEVDGKKYEITNVTDINNSFEQTSCKSSKKISYALNIFTKLFSKEKGTKKPNFNENSVIDFHGEFELNNGVKLLMETKGKLCDYILTGSSFVLKETVDETHFKYQGQNNVGVIDFKRVEQEICCYVPGEVSHIENIMAKEYKEKSSRSLYKSELTTEQTRDITKEEMTDTTSTSRNEMNQEVSEILDTEKSVGISFGIGGEVHGGVSGAWGFSVRADMNSDFSFSTSSSKSNSFSKTFAQEITSKALERIVQNVKRRRTSIITKEFEENYQHGYDNRKGDQHVTGVYRWIDKVYNNRLINYGKRFVYEFIIPEPAKVYKELITLDAEEEQTNNNVSSGSMLVKPDHPSSFGINTSDDINRTNYKSLAAYYGVEVEVPKEQTMYITKAHSESIGDSTDYLQFVYSDMMIDEDYYCDYIEHNGEYGVWSFHSPHADININMGGGVYKRTSLYGRYKKSMNYSINISPTTGNISLVIGTHDIEYFSITTKLKCTLKESAYNRWQQDVFVAIMQAYNDKLEAYNDALEQKAQEQKAAEGEKQKTYGGNPRFNEMTIVNELKRLSIELLMAPFENKYKNISFYKNDENNDCTIPSLKNLDKLDAYGKRVKFFEQAFDWDLMAKMFYDYYWSDKCSWKELYQSQGKAGADFIFSKFLQSSLARIIVPIKEGFEQAVIYYIETGDIWNGTSMVINTDDDKYLSAVNELYYTDGVVEDKWQSIVPTSLTIIQGKSVFLEDEGLPCCTDVDNIQGIKFKSYDAKLSGVDNAPNGN